jgi:hypothetical protein
MRRVYFLVPNIDIAKKVVNDLLLARIEERRIHVLAKRGTPMEDLPEASILQKTDFIPALEQGVALGATSGVVAGLVAIALPTGLVLGGGAVLAIAFAGAGVGGMMSALIGLDIGDRRIQRFQEDMDNGKFLMMVDVPRTRVDEIEQIVRNHDPEAECEGTEPTIPPFP